MPDQKNVLALYAANASMFRVLLHQFVSTGKTREEMAAIQKAIYDDVMSDLSRAKIDDGIRNAGEEIVASMFGLNSSAPKN